jgi:thiopurine S-methyltransferase
VKKLHIDEEGYPVMDGLRVDDAQTLKEIFAGLRRRTPPGRGPSAVVSTWGGVEIFLEAFSSPLIVQSVEVLTKDLYRANVFGVSFEFSPSQLQIDDWDRLHFYAGAEQIEVTFSRKAQAQFLSSLGETSEIQPAPFRSAAAEVSQSQFWQAAYDNRTDGWDLGAISPSLRALAERTLTGALDVLVPGAGRGYEVQWLAESGHRVLAEDFAPEAQREFRKRFAHSPVTYELRDFFAASDEARFDVVVELIFFCAIDPARRREYFECCHARLRDGGRLVGIFFVNHAPGGPPCSTTLWEIRELSRGLFRMTHAAMSEHSVAPRLGKEYEVVLEKL